VNAFAVSARPAAVNDIADIEPAPPFALKVTVWLIAVHLAYNVTAPVGEIDAPFA